MHDKQINLNEHVSFANAKYEDGIIKGVKLLGEKSKNGNRYPESVRVKAHPIFEGLKVNLNHVNKTNPDVPVQSRFGKIVNVREGKDGTYGDLQYLTKHPFAPTLVEAAQTMPDVYGFSINGKGRVKNNKGETVVESIDSLRSVDLVADPATAKSLFESEEMPETKSCDQLIGELIAALVVEGKEDLVKDVIKLKKKLGGGEAEEEPAEPEAPEEEAPAEESWKNEYETLKLEKKCRCLLESNNVPVERSY